MKMIQKDLNVFKIVLKFLLQIGLKMYVMLMRIELLFLEILKLI